jgi:predicted nucleic acid-binding protein
MGLLLTLDASVLVAACRRDEPGHEASRRLLAALRAADVPLIEPAILPVEIAAALSRTGVPPDLAVEFARGAVELPRVTVVAVDDRLARAAATLAAERRLRGADALYATVAMLYGARLVTLDEEQRRRAPAAAGAIGPAAATALVVSRADPLPLNRI